MSDRNRFTLYSKPDDCQILTGSPIYDDRGKVVAVMNDDHPNRPENGRLLASSHELAEALKPFAALGGSQDEIMTAFHDLEADIVIFENSGNTITVRDIRRARKALGFDSVYDYKRNEP